MGGPPQLFDLTGRGAILLMGKDRASFLHGLVTNDVKVLTPGEGCAAAFLTPKGKLLADCVVLCEKDRLEIDCEPELAEKIEELLRKYLVFNEVEIGNLTSGTAVFHLQHSATGDAVEELLRKVIGRETPDAGAGGAWPQQAHAHFAARLAAAESSFTFKENPPSPATSHSTGDEQGVTVRVVRENRTGVPGYDVRCPPSLSERIRKAVLSAGARQASDAERETLRIQAGIPRWGFELTEAVLPDEAGLRERGFISDTKGCYIGQETVARIKTYGHVNRTLVRLQVEGDASAIGTEIFFDGERAGAVTSVAREAGSGRATALGYVKREWAAPGTALLLRAPGGESRATVAATPFRV